MYAVVNLCFKFIARGEMEMRQLGHLLPGCQTPSNHLPP